MYYLYSRVYPYSNVTILNNLYFSNFVVSPGLSEITASLVLDGPPFEQVCFLVWELDHIDG